MGLSRPVVGLLYVIVMGQGVAQLIEALRYKPERFH
jgi:hypothetical protein